MSLQHLIPKVLSFHETHPEAVDINLKDRARIVLLEAFGTEPSKSNVLSLYVAAKRAFTSEKADRAFFKQLRNRDDNNVKQRQTGGGHQVIKKPEVFGG